METENMKTNKDWLEYIADKVNKYYSGRKVVLWGFYPVSKDIESILKNKFEIDVALYVDSDVNKLDHNRVFPTDCLDGRAAEYYVVIPIAYYQSVKDRMNAWGYKKDADYYYFCDCIIREDEDYYEDTHGNKVIGRHQGLKFVFSGFNSRIEIGENVNVGNTSIYLHNDCRVSIAKNSSVNDCEFQMSNFVDKYAGNVCVDGDAHLEIGEDSCVQSLNLLFYQYSKITLGKNVNIQNDKSFKWEVGMACEFEIDDRGNFPNGDILMFAGSLLKIGKRFLTGPRYKFFVDCYTSAVIGNDCLFSWDIIILSNDGHSIFDIFTEKNINYIDSSYDSYKCRKVEIGNHVWLGMRTIILYGTKIKDGSVIGGGSLVKSIIPNNCIAAGSPAKVIKKNIAWAMEKCSEDIKECGQEYINITM